LTPIGYFAIAGGLALTAIALFFARRFLKPGTRRTRISAIYSPYGGIIGFPINPRRFDIETILKIVGALVAVLSVAGGVFQFAVNQRERIENETRSEYIRATQLLTESGQERPMAGIAALAQLAENNVDRTWLMTESLSAFVRFRVQRSGPSQSQSRVSPYPDPPNNKQDPLDEKYFYSKYSTFQPIYQKNPAVQGALNALGNRNPQNETRGNVPRRFKSQLEADNHPLPRGVEPRASVISYINEHWVGKHEESDTQFVQEIQVGVLSAYPDIVKRPWLNLSHSLLVGSEMTSPFLEGGKFRESDLSFSQLARAKLANADLSEAWLVGANLFGADLKGATMEHADVRGADLGGADLRKAWMSRGRFFRANFWQADLSGAYLVASDMKEIQQMAGAQLDWSIAFRADFSDAMIAPGDPNEIVCMRHAFLKEAVFARAYLQRADLEYSEMQGADFSDAHLSGADFRGVALEGAKLEGADLSGADLRGVDLTKVQGTPSRIEGALVNNMTAFPPSWPATFAQQVIVNPPSPLASKMNARRPQDQIRNAPSSYFGVKSKCLP
jgi:uncharacterized protein YjbI with pentapeptide repeats